MLIKGINRKHKQKPLQQTFLKYKVESFSTKICNKDTVFSLFMLFNITYQCSTARVGTKELEKQEKNCHYTEIMWLYIQKIK